MSKPQTSSAKPPTGPINFLPAPMDLSISQVCINLTPTETTGSSGYRKIPIPPKECGRH